MLKDMGSRLKNVRVYFKFSQDKFSKMLGVSQFTLSNYEMGKRFPDTRFLVKLKELTDVDLNWMISGERVFADSAPGFLVSEEMKNFFYWFGKLPMLRHSVYLELDRLKAAYPLLFKKEEV